MFNKGLLQYKFLNQIIPVNNHFHMFSKMKIFIPDIVPGFSLGFFIRDMDGRVLIENMYLNVQKTLKTIIFEVHFMTIINPVMAYTTLIDPHVV